MGIVFKQSLKNTIILFLGFGMGGLNVLFLYTHFLKEEYFGLITFLLSTANIILPLLVFGMQHTIIKFFSAYKTKVQQDSFLVSSLILPLFLILPIGAVGVYSYEEIAHLISIKNELIKDYTYLIFLVAVFMGYFEVFYAWTRVQMNSVFGNFIKEVFARACTSLLLIVVYLGYLTDQEFIYAIILVYLLRMLIMMLYAFYLYTPKLIFKFPSNLKELLSFSVYIIVAGSAGGILLEIDKFMIPQIKEIAYVAYYSVGIYIASVIAIPSRAMQQIINPITAKELNNNNMGEVKELYKKSSINLLVTGGLLFLLINLNVKDLYHIINKPEFSQGVLIVLMISVSEMYKLALGNNGAILTNSKYYRVFFYLSIAMAISVIILNKWLIQLMGINGAALATLLVVFIFNTVKVLYIQVKLKMQPFSWKTVQVLLLISILYLGFSFWMFPFHPFVNIALKSVLIVAVYYFGIRKMVISAELDYVVNRFFKK